jgi:hypothetical protein
MTQFDGNLSGLVAFGLGVIAVLWLLNWRAQRSRLALIMAVAFGLPALALLIGIALRET